MRKILRATKFTVLSLVVLLLIATGAVLALRTHRQNVTAQAIAIHAPNGIDEAMYVKIGGIDQWIQIRGQDRNNPILLCLHGGPGATWLPLTALFRGWEREFTVVQWDQRGAGKTLETTGASVADTMSVDRMAEDGIEVSGFLLSHLHKDKIVLLGHSWGSILGIHMAKRRPDLFYAYVGTGQVSNMARSLQLGYANVLEKARAVNDTGAVNALEQIGPPPYDSLHKVAVYFEELGAYEVESDRVAQSSLIGRLTFEAPNLSFWDVYNRMRGFALVPTWRLYGEMLSTDLRSLGRDFEIPIFLFQGEKDDVTSTPLAQEYFAEINAPHKEVVLFEGTGHFAAWSMPDRFLQELVGRVRPRATPP